MNLESGVKNLFLSNVPNLSQDTRDLKLTLRFMGWDGDVSCSLQQAGEPYGLSRERVRQITTGITQRLQPSASAHLPMVPALVERIAAEAPASASRIEAILKEELGNVRLEGVLKASGLLGHPIKSIKISTEFDDKRFVISPGMEGVAQKVSAAAQKASTHLGVFDIQSLAEQVPGLTQDQAISFVRDVIDERDDHVWLDDEKNWAWLRLAPRNRLVSVLHKILMVYNSTTVDLLLQGANRYFTKGKSKSKLVAPDEVIRNFVNSWGEASCGPNMRIRKTPTFNSKVKLLHFERDLVDLIWDTPEKIAREKYLEKALVPDPADPKKYNFSMNLNHSPLITRGECRGQYINTGFI